MWVSRDPLRSRTNVGGPRCRVLQYVHGLLTVGCESDRNLNPSRWVMAYGNKENLILNAMVGYNDLNDL